MIGIQGKKSRHYLPASLLVEVERDSVRTKAIRFQRDSDFLFIFYFIFLFGGFVQVSFKKMGNKHY